MYISKYFLISPIAFALVRADYVGASNVLQHCYVHIMLNYSMFYLRGFYFITYIYTINMPCTVNVHIYVATELKNDVIATGLHGAQSGVDLPTRQAKRIRDKGTLHIYQVQYVLKII